MEEYRSILGSLMYLVKFQRPELSNYVRELAKGMQGANKTHQNELFRILKWVLTSKTKAIYLKPEQKQELELMLVVDV